MTDIFTHHLVPEHRKLSDDEVAEVLEQYNVTKDKLPKIKEKDEAVKKLDAEKGDVIEISRANVAGEQATYYRVVVED